MKRTSFTFLALAMTVAACGGSNAAQPDPASSASTQATAASTEHKEGSGKHDHHKDLPPALHDFHGVLAPVWHTEAGAARVEKACASANLQALGEKATATSDAQLVTAVKDLEAACAKDGRPEVEAKLAAVHDRFHTVAKVEKH